MARRIRNPGRNDFAADAYVVMAGLIAHTGSPRAGMKTLRHAVLSTPIVTAAFAATLGVMFATASWAGPPACAGSCTPRTALVVPARAAHTDASARHVASSHFARARHHHRHAPRVSR